MVRVENSRGEVSLHAAFGALGRRWAVCSGALVALASLLADAPVSVASLRGTVTCLSLVGLTRAGEWIGQRTVSSPRAVSGDRADESPLEAHR